ncbi:MAG: hypothetical protein FWD45_04360 [Coriobacteriia bacterium]|nr:hypothetical protein [Coriobacteriia bacterium]
MGILQNIISDVDASSSIEDTVKESLTYLMELAESKALIFEQAIINDLTTGKTIDLLSVPTTRTISKRIEYRAVTSNTTSNILEVITSAVFEMVGSQSVKGVVNGIVGVAHDVLDTVLGVAAGQEKTMTSYIVAPVFPSIRRYDFAFWARGVSAKAIRQHVQAAIVCVVYESAVDVNKITLSDFLTIYAPVINKAYPDNDNNVDKFSMIAEAKALYQVLITDQTRSLSEAGGLRVAQISQGSDRAQASGDVISDSNLAILLGITEDEIATVLANSAVRKTPFGF